MSWFKKENNITDKPELPDLPDIDTNPLSAMPSAMSVSPTKKISLSPEMSPIPPKNNLPELPENKPKKIQGMQKSKFESILPELPQGKISGFGIEELPEPMHYEPPSIGSFDLTSKSPKVQQQAPSYIDRDEEYPATLSLKPFTKSLPKKEDSVYIRLDKFQATMQAFRDILTRIREIEDLLARTKEIKTREEKELEEWEREIQAIKIRINSIDKEISSS